MTQQLRKPEYVDHTADARAGSTGIEPPFEFTGVTTHVFPLQANIARLRGFCDQYLNVCPPHIAEFRPALPYVYLMVLNYGSMSVTSVQAQNVGWVAQHEVTFTVPLEWWREEGGKMVFKDWACVSPFIYVSDEMSLVTGREVYGWPKVLARVVPSLPLWSTHPRAADRVLSLSTKIFGKVYAGRRDEERILLEIDRDPPPDFSRFPLDLRSPSSPLRAWPAAIRAALDLMGQGLDLIVAAPVRGYRSARDPETLARMLRRASGSMARLLPDALLPLAGGRSARSAGGQSRPELSFEQITLKQFRDVEDPSQACYTALVASRMGIDRLNGAGFLGDPNLLWGDPAGGYTVRIHCYTEQPIIESLGLEVASKQQGGEGAAVALLKPVFPFWLDQDLSYGKGQVIGSRTADDGDPRSRGWVSERERPVAPAARDPASADTAQSEERSPNLYDMALGAATQAVAGPFNFPDVTVQVYPLRADAERISAFLDRYLNDPLRSTGLRFEGFGSYAYLMVNVCDDQTGTMWSSENNIGWWADREVSFCVPVKWYQKRGDREELISLALVAPFVYANNDRAVISDREVNGRPTILADIDSPHDVWLTRSGPAQSRRMLKLQTEVFPALHLGQRSEQRTLLEIDGDDVLPYNSDVGWRLVAEQWGLELVEDLKRKSYEKTAHDGELEDVKTLALEILAHGAPINWVVLKQYRDANEMQRACYQAAVHTTRSIKSILDIREIEERVHVRLHRHPGHPIAELLGLKIKTVDSRDGEIVQNLEPIRPFWMRISVQEDLGRIIAWRAVDGPWEVIHPWFNDRQPPGATPYFRGDAVTRVGHGMASGQKLREKSVNWLRVALCEELREIREALKQSTSGTPATADLRLVASERAALQALESEDGGKLFSETMDVEALMGLVESLRTRLRGREIRTRRLSRAAARRAVETLSELQLPIESILSEAWENWGSGSNGKPVPCIRVGSVWGGSWILKSEYMEPWARSHGLTRWPDPEGGPWWYIESRGGSAGKAGRGGSNG